MNWTRTLGRSLLLGAGSILALACSKSEEIPLTLQVGPGQTIQFHATTALAHYYELPGKEDLLRIVVASYNIGCHEYRPPAPGEVFVSVNVRVPPGQVLKVGKIAWNGQARNEATNPDEPLDSATASQLSSPQPVALPFVRLANEGRPLPPGGHLKLKVFERMPHGLVEGDFSFRDGGEGQASTAALMGPFSLRLCHLDLDMNRGEKSTEK